MTALTQESLEQTLIKMAGHIDSMEKRITMRPTHLIVPPAIFDKLMYRTPIRKARSIRGRKRALYWRKIPTLWKMMK